MKRTATQIGVVTIGAWVCVMAGVAGVAGAAREASSRDSQAGSVVTVSGCLLQISSTANTVSGNTPDGTTTSAGSINQPSTASSTGEERFILANVRPAKDEGQEPGVPGAAGATGVSAQRSLVTGLSRDDLRKHINHQVELSGRVEESREPDSGRAAAADDRPGESTPLSAAARIDELPQLNTTSLRMIAGACSSPGSPD